MTPLPVPKRKRSDTAYFDFEFRGGQEINDAKLVALKARKIVNARNFILHEPYWSESLLRSFIDVFRHFAEREIRWESLELIPREGYFSSNTHYYLRYLLFVANTMNLFQKYDLYVPLVPEGEISELGCILSGITLNTQLKSLAISCPFEIISKGDFRELRNLLKTRTSSLNELTLNGLRITSTELPQALAANKTLEKLTLNVKGDDRALATIVEAVANHPRLKELTIHTVNQLGGLSSKALQTLLVSSTPLETLIVQDKNPYTSHDGSGKLNADHILQGLRGNRSLQHLSMKNALDGDFIFSRFFQVLQSYCPTMERFDLLRTKISEQDLQRVVKMDRLKRPIRLQLNRRILKVSTLTFKQFLCAHPEIRRPWPQSITARTKEGMQLQHVWDLNWHGRHLLMDQLQSTAVPLSLWPLVLESANSKPSVMYEFLQGPAFAGKRNFM
jgi:hypothetical protein